MERAFDLIQDTLRRLLMTLTESSAPYRQRLLLLSSTRLTLFTKPPTEELQEALQVSEKYHEVVALVQRCEGRAVQPEKLEDAVTYCTQLVRSWTLHGDDVRQLCTHVQEALKELSECLVPLENLGADKAADDAEDDASVPSMSYDDALAQAGLCDQD